MQRRTRLWEFGMWTGIWEFGRAKIPIPIPKLPWELGIRTAGPEDLRAGPRRSWDRRRFRLVVRSLVVAGAHPEELRALPRRRRRGLRRRRRRGLLLGCLFEIYRSKKNVVLSKGYLPTRAASIKPRRNLTEFESNLNRFFF